MKSVESAADMEFTTKIFEVAIVSDFAHDITRCCLKIGIRSIMFPVTKWSAPEGFDLTICEP